LYLVSPTQEQLNSWFKCNSIIGNWLERNGVPVIHNDKKYSYFLKTKLLEATLEEIPFWLKIIGWM